ncbi:MAG: hypothetical protein ABI277_07330 [Burkholderiaceae bacterium]
MYRRAAKVLASFELRVNFDAGKKNSTSYAVNGITHMIITDRSGLHRADQSRLRRSGPRPHINHALLARD